MIRVFALEHKWATRDAQVHGAWSMEHGRELIDLLAGRTERNDDQISGIW